VLTVASWGAARALDAPRDLLAPRGVLPWLLAFTQQILRLISVFLGLGVLAAVVPTDVAPALPFVVLGLALAVGWSARDLLPDLIAALVLAAERRIRPGQWIATDAVSGVVEQATVRVVWVRDATGRRIALPNRMMLARPVVTDRGRWPSVEVVLRVPLGHPPGRVRRILEDAVLVSPWAAPRPPEMVREEDEPGRWRVRARVLEGRFADRFEGALREHVEESLVRGAGLRG
jgi:small-conductance mechanosensitive channel